MSPLLSAAAAAARRGLGRAPSVAATTKMLGRRIMYSSHCNPFCEFRFLDKAAIAVILWVSIGMNKTIASIREDMKASNDEILALLKKDKKSDRSVVVQDPPPPPDVAT